MFGFTNAFSSSMHTLEAEKRRRERRHENEKAKHSLRVARCKEIHEELLREHEKRKTARNHEAYCSLNYEGFSDEESIKILKLIKDGKIANVSINYDK
jgi:hypothetical protein